MKINWKCNVSDLKGKAGSTGPAHEGQHPKKVVNFSCGTVFGCMRKTLKYVFIFSGLFRDLLYLIHSSLKET